AIVAHLAPFGDVAVEAFPAQMREDGVNGGRIVAKHGVLLRCPFQLVITHLSYYAPIHKLATIYLRETRESAVLPAPEARSPHSSFYLLCDRRAPCAPEIHCSRRRICCGIPANETKQQ